MYLGFILLLQMDQLSDRSSVANVKEIKQAREGEEKVKERVRGKTGEIAKGREDLLGGEEKKRCQRMRQKVNEDLREKIEMAVDEGFKMEWNRGQVKRVFSRESVRVVVIGA